MLPVALVSCFFFCLIAIYFSEKEGKLRKKLLKQQAEYKKAAEELKETEKTIAQMQQTTNSDQAILHSLAENIEDGLVILTQAHTVTLINPLAKDILQLANKHTAVDDIAQALGKHFDLKAKIAQVQETHKTLQENHMRIGEKTIDIKISYSPVGILVMLRDISMQTSISKIKEDFTNAVVHELRSPLTAIKSATSIILDEKENLNDTTIQFLNLISSQAEKMLDDIATLLDAAKIESGRLSVIQRPTSIDRIISDAITLFTPQAQKKQITIETDMEPELPQANCDNTRIEQVLNNLLSNSLKFTTAGGSIHITAKQSYNEHLPKTLTNPGILISVSDTGVGIPKEKQTTLFSKFSQAHIPGHPQHHGSSGLGLYITKGIVTAHGGGMYMQSEEGKGTTISFTLPLAGQKITAKVMTAKAILQQPMQVIHGLH